MIAVPPIIDPDTFALARSRLEQGARFAARNARKPSLLRGLLVCRECGYAWHRVEKGKQTKRVLYQCRSRSLRVAERRCTSTPVRAAELDYLVWGEIRRLLHEPDLVRAEIDRRLQSMRESDPAARRGQTLAAELTQRNVKRWQPGDRRKRWTAAGMLVAEQQFRRIIGYNDLATLVIAIERHHLTHNTHDELTAPTDTPSAAALVTV